MTKRGRPDKLTKDVAESVIRSMKAGNYIDTAAALAGVSRTTVFAWIRRGRQERRGKYRDFLNAVQHARALTEQRFLLRIDEAAKEDWRAAAWRLEKMNPKRYYPKVRTELTGKNGGPVRVDTRSADEMTDEELIAIAKGAK